MSGRLKKPELLAPAGNLECAVAAFDSGADAVYAGLSRFNAREKSDNFSFHDMSKLSFYAKKHRKKVYLTLNTLIKERELEDVYNYLLEISPLGLDAVIVQDVGVVRMIREFFPEMTIHASTQMGIHNSAGIQLAEIMGISRVILERQVTLSELDRIIPRSRLEIEVFIHGALCCSLSGNCLFSSWIGGWSGNRGKCKQPCRRRYHGKNGENGFFFSTNDLFTLDFIPRLKEMNVTSLKIEGRLKKADYVSRSVSAYRMMLDAEPDREREVLGRAKSVLAGSPGRKWSSGFYTEESLKTVVQHTSSGVSGSLCGEIKTVSENMFTVMVSRELKRGDRIRIQPRSADEGPQITITAMKKNGRLVEKSRKGDVITILSGKKIPDKALVYKVGETPGTLSVDIANLEELPPIIPLNISITLSRNSIQIVCHNFINIPVWKKELTLEKADTKEIAENIVRQTFTSTRDDRIKAGKIAVHIEGNPFVPMSLLKKVRREFWEWVVYHKDDLFNEENSTRKVQTFIQSHFMTHPVVTGEKQYPIYDTYMVSTKDKRSISAGDKTIRCMSIFTYDKNAEEVFLPCFSKEEDIARQKEKIEAAYAEGIRRFRIRSLYQIILLEKFQDIFITAAYPLPVSNSFSARELKMLGVDNIQSWVEMEKQAALDLIDYSPLPVEIYRFGRPHILATRAEIHTKGEISDSHGVEFIVDKDQYESLTFIHGKVPMKIPSLPLSGNCFDLTHADFSEKTTTEFNFSKEWI